jgi:hypothetical protein
MYGILYLFIIIYIYIHIYVYFLAVERKNNELYKHNKCDIHACIGNNNM